MKSFSWSRGAVQHLVHSEDTNTTLDEERDVEHVLHGVAEGLGVDHELEISHLRNAT